MQAHTEKRNDSRAFAENLRVTLAAAFAFFLHGAEAQDAQKGKKHVIRKEDSPLIVSSWF